MSYEKVSFSEMWDFNENKELEGYYLGKKEDVGENHSRIYQVELDSGEITEFWGATALDSQMDRVSIGSRIKIIYNGLVDSPKRKGKQYKSFDVLVDKDLTKSFE